MKNRILSLTISAMLIFLIPIFSIPSAFADENIIDLDRQGSVSVTLKDENSAVVGAELGIYRIADAVVQDDTVSYELREDFRDLGISADKLTEEDSVNAVTEQIKKNNVSGIKGLTDSSGNVSFEGLSVGVYCVMQTKSVSEYSDCMPFVISIPVLSDGVYIYDVDATPKTSVEKLINITVELVWNDDKPSESHPPIRVDLIRDGIIVDTVILYEENGWTHTWIKYPSSDKWEVIQRDIPDGYSVKYDKETNHFILINSNKLIQTGQLNWPIPVLAVAGLVLVMIGWVLLIRKGKQ